MVGAIVKEELINNFIEFLKEQKELSESVVENLKVFLGKHSEVAIYKNKDQIYHENDMATHMYYIDKGSVKVSRKVEKDEDTIISSYQAKTIIGTSLFESDIYIVTMTALEETMTLKIDADFRECIASDANLTHAIMKIVVKKRNMITKKLLDITTKNAKDKIMNYFESCNHKLVEVDDMRLYEIDNKMKNYDLAKMLDMRPEVLSRNITELIDDGLLYKRIGTYYLRNIKDEDKR